MEELLTVKEVSRFLKLTPGAVYAKVSRGEIEAVPIGEGPKPRIRVPASELDRITHPQHKSVIDAELNQLRQALQRKEAP